MVTILKANANAKARMIPIRPRPRPTSCWTYVVDTTKLLCIQWQLVNFVNIVC